MKKLECEIKVTKIGILFECTIFRFLFGENLRVSKKVGTRNVVNYASAGQSQKKFWWKFEMVLTCKSFIRLKYSGERLIELRSSWFPPKYLSGQLESQKIFFYELHAVKLMIRGIGEIFSLAYSQTLNVCVHQIS